MPWRLMSSTKTPWPSTSLLSSLRGTLCPTAEPFCRVPASVSTAVIAHLLHRRRRPPRRCSSSRCSGRGSPAARPSPRARSGAGSAPAARSRSSACPVCSSRTGGRGARWNDFCSGVSSPSSPARPSTVVIEAPSACTASMQQLLTASAPSCTVHAPQLPVSQPTWVPVRSRSSRRKCTSSRDAGTSRS